MNGPDFYSVQEWREAGEPLDKSFVIVRRAGLFPIDTPAETIQARCVEKTKAACNFIIRGVELYQRDVGAKRFDIAPLSAPFCFQYTFFGYTFSIALVYNDTGAKFVFTDPVQVQRGGWSFEAGAIVTLHSEVEQWLQ